MSTMNLRPCEEPMPVDGPVREIVKDGKIQKGYKRWFTPEEWARRLAPQDIPTDWFPTRLERPCAPGIGTFQQPSEAGRRKRATAYRQRKTKTAKIGSES